MGFDMRPTLLAGVMLLALAGCGKDEANSSDAEQAETPRIASLEDYDLPVDKSDQITAIDAATGDAGGMPRDGGATIAIPKQEARVGAQNAPASNASMALPEVAAPPPPAAPALSVPLEN